MGALNNAAKFAKDTASGGFRDMALAALVNQARTTLGAAAPAPGELAYAKAIIRQAPTFADVAAWAAATDPACSAAAVPTEGQILNAITVAWPYLWALGLSPA